MRTDGVYRTSDLYVAAWLLHNGLQVQGVDHHNPRRCDFIFLDREDKTLEDISGQPLQNLSPKSGQE